MPLAQINAGTIYTTHANHLGAPQSLTDANKAIVWDASFAPFGDTTDETGAVTSNLRFPGQYFDEETGTHYNYFRDYDPAVGRYLQSDPIGLAGGLNTYGYADGSPTVRIDPPGLWSTPARNWALSCMGAPVMYPANADAANATGTGVRGSILPGFC